MTRPRTVLVVEADGDERRLHLSWLEGAGFEVLSCPGPTGPDYSCVGARRGTCPLVEASELVVLDMCLESETMMMGTAAEEILGSYLFSGRRVVALGSHVAEEIPGQLARLPRHPDRERLVAALTALAP